MHGNVAGIVPVVMLAFGLSNLHAENRLMQVITVLGGLVGIAAGVAQVIGNALRNPWENERQ
jgi:hypothetical protein